MTPPKQHNEDDKTRLFIQMNFTVLYLNTYCKTKTTFNSIELDTSRGNLGQRVRDIRSSAAIPQQLIYTWKRKRRITSAAYCISVIIIRNEGFLSVLSEAPRKEQFLFVFIIMLAVGKICAAIV